MLDDTSYASRFRPKDKPVQPSKWVYEKIPCADKSFMHGINVTYFI